MEKETPKKAPKAPKESSESIGTLERIGTSFDNLRGLGTKFLRIGVLMAKGAYLMGERRQLFLKLGQAVYDKVQKGELKNAELEPIVHQLDRMTKKVEIEEILIRRLRFHRSSRANRAETTKQTEKAAEKNV